MKKLIVLFSLGIFLSALCPAFGIPYSVGNYLVDVEVRNSAITLIPKARVSCRMENKLIVVRASAPGYLSSKTTITPNGSSGYFKRDMVLQDVPKELFAEDTRGKPLKSVYFIKDQYGFDPREYGIIAFIPVKDWKTPSPKKVNVFDLAWSVPMKQSCQITQVDEYYKVRLTVSRGDLDLTSRELLVVFSTGTPGSVNPPQTLVATLGKMEKTQSRYSPGASMELAEFLFNSYGEEELRSVSRGPLPASLEGLYGQARRFSLLHRENVESPLQ